MLRPYIGQAPGRNVLHNYINYNELYMPLG